MVDLLQRNDSIKNWKDKINAKFGEIDEIIAFEVVDDETDLLDITLEAGRVRSKTDIITVAKTTLTLPQSETVFVGIDTSVDGAASIVSFTSANKPEDDFIPLYQCTTSVSAITNIDDIRSMVTISAGKNVKTAEAILMFDKNISLDTTIPADRNAISVDPTVDDGVEVTVSDGSVWSIV